MERTKLKDKGVRREAYDGGVCDVCVARVLCVFTISVCTPVLCVYCMCSVSLLCVLCVCNVCICCVVCLLCSVYVWGGVLCV